MIIQPTDWVWFTFQGHTQFGEFSYIHPEIQYSLEQIFARRPKTYNMTSHNEELTLHAVVPNEGKIHARKLQYLFKGANKPNFWLKGLPSGDHWIHGEMPKYGPIEALDDVSSFSYRKDVFLRYIEFLCGFVKVPEPPTFKESKVKQTWDDGWRTKLLQQIRLEGKPMKVKQYMIELKEFEEGEREFLLLKTRETNTMTPRDILLTLESMYVDTEKVYDMVHGILSIGDGRYKIGSGNIEYTEERAKLVGEKGWLDEVSFINLAPHRLYYTDKEITPKTGEMKSVEKEVIVKIPVKFDIKRVIKYYQTKYPNKNYSLDNKNRKKELSERSQKLEDLPQKGETQGKDLRKVCYRAVGGLKVFRDRLDKVQPLVDAGNYEFVPKHMWKSQIIAEDGVGLVKEGTDHKTNIVKSPTGRRIGERKEKRERRDSDRQMKAVRSLQARYSRQAQSKPGYAERKLQSEKDKKAYVKKRKAEGKPINSYRTARAFEAVVLGDKAKVLATLNIKAKSVEEAEKKLASIATNKGKELTLTGNVRDWVKQTGTCRPKKKPVKQIEKNEK